ncbi:unnamed protein product [Cuscuta epithymum]|uniref:Ribosomal protein S14 n=1 Tax=Cuscuta epithymum TaxID=186058 RepID=A0AAV0D657_9ASTE|nr:unnamed protein product [Cuscuta epithymum]
MRKKRRKKKPLAVASDEVNRSSLISKYMDLVKSIWKLSVKFAAKIEAHRCQNFLPEKALRLGPRQRQHRPLGDLLSDFILRVEWSKQRHLCPAPSVSNPKFGKFIRFGLICRNLSQNLVIVLLSGPYDIERWKY